MKNRGYAGAMGRQGKKVGTTFPGVRYREHLTRKNGNGPDRYFYIRTYADGREREEGLGWASEGWSAKKAAGLLARIREAQTTGVGPQSLAEARELSRQQRLARAREARRAALASMTVCEAALDYYMPVARREKRSWYSDASRLETHILPEFGPVPLRDVTRTHIEAFLASLRRRGLAPATVTRCLALLRRLFNFCALVTVQDTPLFQGANPASGITVRQPDNSRLRFLTRAEADELIAASEDFGRDRDMRDMIVLSLHTGMRLGEIMRLRRPDVDLTHGLIHILDRDGKPGGVVYLNRLTRGLAERRLAEQTENPLFFVPPAGGRMRENMSQRFKELVDRLGFNAGIEDPRQRVVFHTLRHTFASWLALAGTDIYMIMKLMRHKTISMTMRYAHLIPDAKRRAVEDLCPAAPPDSPDA